MTGRDNARPSLPLRQRRLDRLRVLDEVAARNREYAHLAYFEFDPVERQAWQQLVQRPFAFAYLYDEPAVGTEVLRRLVEDVQGEVEPVVACDQTERRFVAYSAGNAANSCSVT